MSRPYQRLMGVLSKTRNSYMNELNFTGYLQGKRTMMIFDWHANSYFKFGNRHFCSRGYYVSKIGLNEATIANS